MNITTLCFCCLLKFCAFETYSCVQKKALKWPADVALFVILFPSDSQCSCCCTCCFPSLKPHNGALRQMLDQMIRRTVFCVSRLQNTLAFEVFWVKGGKQSCTNYSIHNFLIRRTKTDVLLLVKTKWLLHMSADPKNCFPCTAKCAKVTTSLSCGVHFLPIPICFGMLCRQGKITEAYFVVNKIIT